ncbi:MAG: hypothetical protein HYU29_02765 [Chloroflexi bacterium]|nr:hypothetical protein [Chloroflexota bacterium]
MSASFFNDDFFRSLLTTFLGAVLAILTAFGGWWFSGKGKRKAAELRRSQLAKALSQSLEHNLELAKLASQLTEKQRLTVNVDLSVLEATRSLKYDILLDIDLSRDVDEVSYQLASLRRLIDLAFGFEFSTMSLAFTGRDQARADLYKLIRERGTKALQYEEGKQVLGRLQEMFKTRSVPRTRT